MSKSAIKAVEKAQEVIATSTTGAKVDLVGYLKDETIRKNWRNADLLACLLINSVADAFQCETAESLEANLFDNMDQAIETYIQSNLDSWNNKTWPDSLRDTTDQLIRLALMVERDNVYNRTK
ncbi:hypothetical protein [Escherichia phage phiWec190]|uniref:hypothetical protein n=1 Tax=Escherichia coli TaxID=562 RepID=UPI001FF6DB82|nr:hypothetical protein [Escherichia coli]MCJ8478848.1 hypothetical protein [Escherichia coli]BDU13339.1 hypothetical protein [Escherichia phage phiWec188]BDU13855.1 hypothetical protein [Escherichia phage phiWec190]